MNKQYISPVEVTDDATGLEHISVIKRSGEGHVIGFSESDRNNLESAADLQGNDVRSRLTGETRKGEADTLSSAKILIDKLNSLGAVWGNPRLAKEPADCEVEDQKSPGKILSIQIIRAISNPDLWQQLSLVGSVDKSDDLASLIGELRIAIQKKIDHYPFTVRNRLVLALDANRYPAFCLSKVRDAAIEQLGSFCAESSFASVWVIGPKSDLTYALFDNRIWSAYGKPLIERQIKTGHVIEIEPDSEYGYGEVYGGRWFKVIGSGEVWRLIEPDFPFKGLWEPVQGE